MLHIYLSNSPLKLNLSSQCCLRNCHLITACTLRCLVVHRFTVHLKVRYVLLTPGGFIRFVFDLSFFSFFFFKGMIHVGATTDRSSSLRYFTSLHKIETEIDSSHLSVKGKVLFLFKSFEPLSLARSFIYFLQRAEAHSWLVIKLCGRRCLASEFQMSKKNSAATSSAWTSKEMKVNKWSDEKAEVSVSWDSWVGLSRWATALILCTTEVLAHHRKNKTGLKHIQSTVFRLNELITTSLHSAVFLPKSSCHH